MINTHLFSNLTRALSVLLSLPRRCGAPSTLVLALALGAAGHSLQAQEAVPPASSVTTSVNINTADAAALAAGLSGVGPSRAEEIVRYREAYGPFASVDELTEVNGIGESTLEKNRAVITLE